MRFDSKLRIFIFTSLAIGLSFFITQKAWATDWSGGFQSCWQDVMHTPSGDPTGISLCCDSGGMGIKGVGVYSDEYVKRQSCVEACADLDNSWVQSEQWSKRFEELCCNLNSPVEATQNRLDAKCKLAANHTGSEGCASGLTSGEQRPDGITNCCKQSGSRNSCTVDVYSGSDSCKADGTFTCCSCKGKDDNGNDKTIKSAERWQNGYSYFLYRRYVFCIQHIPGWYVANGHYSYNSL